MINRERTFFAVLLALLIYPGDNLGRAFQPEFVKPLANLTVPVGRDAVFTCHVEHLGGYRVGWVKADTKAIQAIHEHVITHNPRVSVSHGDHTSWSLRIKGAQKEDEGLYMCQINTDPMKFQTGMLTVDVPPDFLPEMTSGDVMVREGERVQLKCRATGIPQPRVTWRREDQKEIIIREPLSDKSTGSNEKPKVYKVTEWTGEQLNLTKIKRDQMGVYNCLASNGVPPSISKRIIVDVQFPPMIHAPNQLVGAPLGTNVTLECIVEASPQSINFWLDNKDAMIMSSARHEAQVVTKTPSKSHPNFNYKVKMLLKIHNFTKQDIGTYKCSAKNSLGDFESSIRLYDITNAVKHSHSNAPAYIESHPIDPSNRLDPNNNHRNNNPNQGNDAIDEAAYGSVSAEFDHGDNGRPLHLDNTVQGQIGSNQLSTPASSVRVRGKRPNGSHHQQHSAASTTRSDCAMMESLLILLLLYYGR